MSKPTHDDISARAQQLWHERGKPSGQDDEIWLEAERQLAPSSSKGGPSSQHASATLSESQSDHAIEERLQQQRKDSRAPITPTTSAPATKPAPPGKPLWSKPHSS